MSNPFEAGPTYRITHVTFADGALHFETEEARRNPKGRVELHRAPTPCAERQALSAWLGPLAG
ncbi:MAG: hypothetical protein GAK43_01456 [Stenotrophomonas maltophilia]|nr:MAG: hypothetical protein GAK43_01456 [Stenotrophomonas maltophilia]